MLRKGGAVSHDRAPWEGVRGARRFDFLAGSGCRHKRRVSESKTARAAAEGGVGGRRTHAHRADLVPSAIKRFGVRQVRRWWVVGEEERRPGQRHRAADCRQQRAEERWQPAAAGRQMPAARLTRWAQRPQLVQGVGRSARTSHISRQSGCPGRDRPRGAPRPGLTCSRRRGQQSCGAAVAGAQLLRRSRARGPGLMQHGRPAL